MFELPGTIDWAHLRSRSVQRRIALVVLAFGVAGALYAFLAPEWYRSSITVVPGGQSTGSGIASLLGGQFAGFASSLAGGALGGGADEQRIAAVLQSYDVSDAVIAKFDLKTRYHETYQENARKKLWEHCEVETLAKPRLVRLSCEDKDPQEAQRMLGFFADYGNQVFHRIGVGSASEQVRYLEKHVSELRAQADETATRMREFQEKYQIVDLDTQAHALVGTMASLNSQRISKRLELDFARKFSASDEVTSKRLASEIAVLDDAMHSMQDAPAPGAVNDGRGSSGQGQKGLFPPALQVPKLRSEFETLYRDRKVAEASLIFALDRLESARADVARDTSTFLVVDPPTLPTKRTRPRRGLVVVQTLLLGLAVAGALEWWISNRRRAALTPATSSAPVEAGHGG